MLQFLETLLHQRLTWLAEINKNKSNPGLPDGFIENQKWTIWSFQSVSGFNIFGLVFGLFGFIWFSNQLYLTVDVIYLQMYKILAF